MRTAQGQVQALGTRFLVSQEGDATRVVVLEHSVRASLPDGRWLDLQQGQAALLHSHIIEPLSEAQEQRAAWLHMIGNVLVMVLSFVNALVHSRDGWTAVVPTGLVLSTIVVLLLLFTGWQGWTMVYRHHVGIAR